MNMLSFQPIVNGSAVIHIDTPLARLPYYLKKTDLYCNINKHNPAFTHIKRYVDILDRPLEIKLRHAITCFTCLLFKELH